MTKKVIILTVYIILMVLVGCGRKDEKSSETDDVDILIEGNYYSEKSNSFIILDVNNKEFVFFVEGCGEVFKYQIEADTMVASNENSKEIVMEIVDSQTLKLEEELFVYQKAESEGDEINLGTYYSKTTCAYFWIENNQKIHYVDEYASGSIEYGYVVDGDRLIATSWLKTMNFEIIDKSCLKLDEDIFYLNTEE